MKNLMKIFIAILPGFLLAPSCGKLDYENKEFYKQEVYIICSESTSAAERVIANVNGYTFVDTLKIINDSYDTDTIYDMKTGYAYVTFKVGIGGSLAASEDINVKLAYDKEILNDYNIEKNTAKYIPDPSHYSTNIPFDEASQTFTLKIKKGESSAALAFIIPIHREKESEYVHYAFPIKIVESEQAPLSRQYTNFLVAGLVVGLQRTVNWSGFPIPKLPEGRYLSARLQGNSENKLADGTYLSHKFITRLNDTPGVDTRYMIWGTAIWSFEQFGFHGSGWMYNILYLNDEVGGTYTMEPILSGNAKFPSKTFAYGSVQEPTIKNKYDPKTKTLTLYYVKANNNDYVDILTYVDDDFTFTKGTQGGTSPTNWNEVRNKGYNYWLPIDGN